MNLQRQKNMGGGGGGGGRGGGRGQHRDYDNPGYGQPSNNNSAAMNNAPAVPAPAGGNGQADPYAACESPLIDLSSSLFIVTNERCRWWLQRLPCPLVSGFGSAASRRR